MGRRRRSRAWLVAAAATVAILVVGAVLWRSGRDSDNGTRGRASASGDPAPTAFGLSAGHVLVFDDGYDGVTLVDLDDQVAVRRPVEGQRAGDQPYRLGIVGSSLVVGWGEVYATPLAGRRSHLLDEATIWIPAVEPGRVWLVDYPGERIGTGVPTLRQVDASGKVHLEAAGLDPFSYYPGIGIPGGIAYETSQGVALWDARSGAIEARLGTTQGFVGDSHDDLLAWCELRCTSLHISRVGAGDVEVMKPGPSDGFDIKSARFSPDGRHLAIIAPGRLVVIDTASGSAQTVQISGAEEFISLAWAPDRHSVYASSNSYLKAETTVSHYDLDTRTFETKSLALGGLLSFVVVEEDRVGAWLESERTDPGTCVPPTIQPSGRTNPCAFEFAVDA